MVHITLLQVDECIARIPLVDNDAEPDEGAITLQEKTWLLSRWLSERNRLRQMGSDCAFKYGTSGIHERKMSSTVL